MEGTELDWIQEAVNRNKINYGLLRPFQLCSQPLWGFCQQLYAVKNMKIMIFNVMFAFLFGNLNEESHMWLPQGYSHPVKICKINHVCIKISNKAVEQEAYCLPQQLCIEMIPGISFWNLLYFVPIIGSLLKLDLI